MCVTNKNWCHSKYDGEKFEASEAWKLQIQMGCKNTPEPYSYCIWLWRQNWWGKRAPPIRMWRRRRKPGGQQYMLVPTHLDYSLLSTVPPNWLMLCYNPQTLMLSHQKPMLQNMPKEEQISPSRPENAYFRIFVLEGQKSTQNTSIIRQL